MVETMLIDEGSRRDLFRRHNSCVDFTFIQENVHLNSQKLARLNIVFERAADRKSGGIRQDKLLRLLPKGQASSIKFQKMLRSEGKSKKQLRIISRGPFLAMFAQESVSFLNSLVVNERKGRERKQKKHNALQRNKPDRARARAQSAPSPSSLNRGSYSISDSKGGKKLGVIQNIELASKSSSNKKKKNKDKSKKKKKNRSKDSKLSSYDVQGNEKNSKPNDYVLDLNGADNLTDSTSVTSKSTKSIISIQGKDSFSEFTDSSDGYESKACDSSSHNLLTYSYSISEDEMDMIALKGQELIVHNKNDNEHLCTFFQSISSFFKNFSSSSKPGYIDTDSPEFNALSSKAHRIEYSPSYSSSPRYMVETSNAKKRRSGRNAVIYPVNTDCPFRQTSTMEPHSKKFTKNMVR